MRKNILLFLQLLPFITIGQATIKINSVPEYYTPLLDTVFLSGNFNGWNPVDTAYMMIPGINGTYSISINGITDSVIEYKFTRGSWSNVETQADGSFLANRSFVFSNGLQIEDTVANWNDMTGTHTAVGNTRILDLDFAMPQLQRQRRIWVYLPPDYYTSNNYYPVLYMQDGQNLFDELYNFAGEWGIDESMDSLAAVLSPEAIIVGIDNGGIDRINEYSPWIDTAYGGGQGDDYVSFICDDLKPFIDGHFRSMPNRNNTGIMGSSMGGLVSFYAAIKRQDVFSRVGIFSPSFWFSDSIYGFINMQGHQQNMRMYFLCGGLEDSVMTAGMQNVYDTLLANGFSSAEMNFLVPSDGQHSEWFWKREFPAAFTWLFGSLVDTKDYSNAENILRVYPQPASSFINVLSYSGAVIRIYNMEGRLMKSFISDKDDSSIDISGFPRGMYILEMSDGTSGLQLAKFIKE